MMLNQIKHSTISHRARSLCQISVMVLSTFFLSSAATVAHHDGYGDIVENLIPSVVSITVQAESSSGGQFQNIPREFREFFEQYMPRERGQKEGQRRPPLVQAVGSGFFISEDGFIVTNAHVVKNGVNIIVELNDSQSFEAEVVGVDPKTDIAVLKIDAGGRKLPALPFGDSDSIRVGDHVLAIGNPMGLDFSVSAGIVSGRNRTLTGGYDDFIQTDAAINSGNSGGPLLNMSGEVVGVNTLYLNDRRANGGSTGIGFAMASVVVEDVVDQLIEYGTTRRGWLGISMQPITEEIAEAIGIEAKSGILVLDLLDGPAADAGVEEGDAIVEFDGRAITDSRDMLRQVAAAGVGAEVDLLIFRRGEERTISVILGSREEAEGQEIYPASRSVPEPKEGNALGLELGELNDQMRQSLELEEDESGLAVLGVDENSEASKKGIRTGDIILQVNFQPVMTLEDMSDAVEMAEGEGKKSLLLFVQRRGQRLYVPLPLGDA